MSDLFRLRLDNASRIAPAPVEWLWEGRIPLGVLSLLVGHPGRGKSTLAYDLAARVSRGQLGRNPANVIVATSEDSLAHTAVPRLMAAGANLERVDFASIQEDGSTFGLTLPDDLPDLEEAIRTYGAALVVLDPVVSHISSDIDSHKDHSVRRALDPISKLAERTGAAVLGIGHLNKSVGSDVLHRMVGSVAFGAAARSVLLFADKPDEPEGTVERALFHAKCNLAPQAAPLRFAIEGRTVTFEDEDIATSGLVWKGEDPSISASSALAPRRDQDQSERDLAGQVILDVLGEGNRRWSDLAELCRDEGASEITARRARDRLKSEGLIKVRKDGLGSWVWSLNANLLTPPDQVQGEQLQKPAVTRDNVPLNGELAHHTDTEQVPDFGWVEEST